MNFARLVKAISSATTELQGRAATAVNQALVIRNWMVGAYVVEYEQKGSDRARYGAELLPRLAKDLAAKGQRGLGVSMLEGMRRLYLCYPQLGAAMPQSLLVDLERPVRRAVNSVTSGHGIAATSKKSNSVTSGHGIAVNVTDRLPTPVAASLLLRLSWSHLLDLIRIDDPWKRAFYENECLKTRWSKRQLQRQIESLLYERAGLSTNKRAVIERARQQEPEESIADLLRDPYVLEFTAIADRAEYSEEQVETVLLHHLQSFLLELGRGFCFEARQFRMTEGRKHHRVDLVFYHRLLRCHVLFDLKVRAFRPADAGQMNFYVNWFKAHMMAPGDTPPVGILLCSDKDGTEVEFATAGMDQKLFVSRYLTKLPSVEKLRTFLETDRHQIEQLAPKAQAAKKPARSKPRD